MNNTKRNLAAMFAILMAATLVVGTAGSFATKTAFAASNNNNGNTVTIEECKNRGSASGFDTTVDQECENLICTHPASGATCVSENEGATTTPVTPATGTLLVKKVVVCDLTTKDRIIRICPKPEAFTITVTGNNPDPASFPGSGTGTLVTLGVGPYSVSEPNHGNFDVSFSADCTGTIAAGDQKTCTVTNTEQE
jgi:hypothetical protein